MILLFQLSVKKYVLAGVMLLFLCLLVFYCHQRIQVTKAANALFELQQSAQSLMHLYSNQGSSTQELSFSSLVEQVARQHQITFSAITPQERELNITLPPMQFNQLIDWLAELQREYGIKVSVLQITTLPPLGMIRVDALRLQRLFSSEGA